MGAMGIEVKARVKNPLHRVTMTDVARRAGVSQTTVSLVLNEVEGARVSLSTRAKVQRAAERLGYRVERDRAPPRGASRLIVMLVDQISTDPWTAIAMDGARERASEHGVSLLCAVTGGQGDADMGADAPWRPMAPIGAIYATINTRRIEPPTALAGGLAVLVNCYTADGGLASILPAEIAGGEGATARLVRAGHQRIGFIGGEPWMDAARDRLVGYRRALASADLPFDPALVRDGDWQPSSGYAQTGALLALDRPPTAIFCGNDLMALGCYDALREAGLRIPRDVAVVGYDDRDIAQHMHPPLTTVLLPHYDMGALAVDLLIERTVRPTGSARAITLECPLVERSSV